MQAVYFGSWKEKVPLASSKSLFSRSSRQTHAERLAGKWGFNFERAHLLLGAYNALHYTN